MPKSWPKFKIKDLEAEIRPERENDRATAFPSKGRCRLVITVDNPGVGEVDLALAAEVVTSRPYSRRIRNKKDGN